MTRQPNPCPSSRCVSGGQATDAGASLPSAPASFFQFIGTAAHHLARVERAIARQEAERGPIADLRKRHRILKARCAALGGQHG